MLAGSIASGLSLAVRERRLILLLWSMHLVLAVCVAGPLLVWGTRALGSSVEGQLMLGGFDPAVFADLAEESSAAIAAFALVSFAALIVATLGAAFISGGVLAVLLRRARAAHVGQPFESTAGAVGPRSGLLAVFFEGAGRYFWRNLGLTFITGVAVVVLAGATFGLARAATSPLEDSLTEAGAWVRGFAPIVAGGLVVLVLALVLDIARLALVAGDRRGVISTWWIGGRSLLRHLGTTVGLWAAFTLLVALAGGIYLWLRNTVPAGTAPAIAFMVLTQQAFVLWRAAMRIGLVGGQIELAAGWRLPGLYEEPTVAGTTDGQGFEEPALGPSQEVASGSLLAEGTVDPIEPVDPADPIASVASGDAAGREQPGGDEQQPAPR